MTSRIARGIGSTIGLAKESIAHRQESKEAEQRLDVPSENASRSPSPQRGSNDGSDQQFWDLDDVAQVEAPPPNPFANVYDAGEISHIFEMMHPPAYAEAIGELPLPVCLPQRRPGSKTRGFIRAYAPVLEEVGIDQKTWLDFLAGFEQAIKMNQTFNAIQVVVRGTDLGLQIASGGNLLIHACSWVLHVSVEASRRCYVQYRTNKYLDDMNQSFFRPHNLYALIMCYKPSDGLEPSDTLTQSVATRVDGDGSKLGSKSGTTRSELELPEAAPLIFPYLDAVPDEAKPGTAKRAGAFMSDYYDRRAQAVFEHNNPNSRLNVDAPRKDFVSRYSDPNSPATQGGLLGLVTGGNVTGPRYRRKEARRRSQLEEKGQVTRRTRLMGQDIYYLMVINLPTDEEIQASKNILLQDMNPA